MSVSKSGRKAYLEEFMKKSGSDNISKGTGANETPPEQSKANEQSDAPTTGIQTPARAHRKTAREDRRSSGTIKATFDLQADLHDRLRLYAASQRGTKMVDVVEAALIQYFSDRENK